MTERNEIGTFPATTRCDVCNSEAIVAKSETHGARTIWIDVECASCGARYSVHKKTRYVTYEPEAQKAVRDFNRMKALGPWEVKP